MKTQTEDICERCKEGDSNHCPGCHERLMECRGTTPDCGLTAETAICCPACHERVAASCDCGAKYPVRDMVETLDGDHMCQECVDESGMT